jgi:hypothetical protein
MEDMSEADINNNVMHTTKFVISLSIHWDWNNLWPFY